MSGDNIGNATIPQDVEHPLGSRSRPYTHAPEKWKTEGVFYGAYCRCHKCGFVSRSTLTFDYYADNVGDPLVCEHCQMGQSYEVAKVMDKIASEE